LEIKAKALQESISLLKSEELETLKLLEESKLGMVLGSQATSGGFYVMGGDTWNVHCDK
jgi:hypothetical protein